MENSFEYQSIILYLDSKTIRTKTNLKMVRVSFHSFNLITLMKIFQGWYVIKNKSFNLMPNWQRNLKKLFEKPFPVIDLHFFLSKV